jgi:hypothetical protein
MDAIFQKGKITDFRRIGFARLQESYTFYGTIRQLPIQFCAKCAKNISASL